MAIKSRAQRIEELRRYYQQQLHPPTTPATGLPLDVCDHCERTSPQDVQLVQSRTSGPDSRYSGQVTRCCRECRGRMFGHWMYANGRVRTRRAKH